MSESFRLGGDPAQIRASARRWSAFSEEASSAASGIRSLDTSDFAGDEAEIYRDQINSDLPRHLELASTAWNVVAAALSGYAADLERHQQTMNALSIKAGNQRSTVNSCQTALDHSQQSDRSHALALIQTRESLEPGEQMPDDSYASATWSNQQSLNDANAALQATCDAASKVRSENAESVRRCRSEIDRAKDMRFAKPPGFWGRLKDSVCGWIADHAGVLLQISSVLKTISAVAGLLSMIPVLAPVMGPIALASGGAALLIDAGVKVATGKGSWTQIGLDALSMIPGARAAKAAFTANAAYGGYQVATGKESVGAFVLNTGMGALAFKGGGKIRDGGPKGPDGPNMPAGHKPGDGGPEFIGMPTHVRTTGPNGLPQHRLRMPERPGESVTVLGGANGATTITAVRTAGGHHVTVDNGGPAVLHVDAPDGTQIHWGDGSGPAASSRAPTRPLPTGRSTRPYAVNGVRVSRDTTQNGMASGMVDEMNQAGMDPRVDQGQVAGPYGYANRPDVSGVLNATQSVHVEYDRVGPGGTQGSRVAGHVDTILGNDPGSILFTVPSP